MSFERKMIIVFFFLILTLTIVGVVAYRNNNTFRNTSYWVEHTHQVLAQSDQVLSNLNDIESGDHSFIITRNYDFLEQFTHSNGMIAGNIKRLKLLTEDNPSQQAKIDTLGELIRVRTMLAIKAIQNTRRQSIDIHTHIKLGKFYMDQIRNIINSIKEEENKILFQLQVTKFNSINKFNRIIFLLLVLIVLLTSISLIFLRYSLLRVQKEAVLKQFNKELEEKVKERTEEIKHSREQLQKIMDQSLDVICTIDEEGCFIQVSAASKNIWGYAPEELNRKKNIDLVAEADKARSNEAYLKTKSGAVSTNFENEYVRKNGSIVSMIWSSSWDETEKIMYCIGRDATDIIAARETIKNSRKALEEEYIRRRILFDQAKDGVMLLNEDRMVVEANKAFAEMLGYKDASSVLGLHVFDWDPVYNTPEKLKASFPCLPPKSETFETSFLRKDGSLLFAQISLNVIDIDGKKILFNVCRDITDRKKYVEAIEEQNARLKEIAWFQSHVVRAPLARIMGLIQILENEPIETESTTEVLNYILLSAKELDIVIKSIVDKTHLEQNDSFLTV
ncbi:MAG: PAS domain S-box protein [Bacteroidia bacterium]|nr:PAS domain S-box protein [Bacteroidia bacterium]